MGDQENESSIWFVYFNMMVDNGVFQDTPVFSRTSQANEYCSTKPCLCFPFPISFSQKLGSGEVLVYTGESWGPARGRELPRTTKPLRPSGGGWGSGSWLSRWKRAWGVLEQMREQGGFRLSFF